MGGPAMSEGSSGHSMREGSVQRLLRLTGDIQQRLQIIEPERGALAPGAGLIFERARERRGKERPILAGILPDCRLDVATSQRGCRSFG